MMDYFSWLLLLPCLSAIAYYSYAIFASLTFFRRSEPLNPHFQPPVTILKPLCGLDSDTYSNLASFCQQDYSQFQMIFAVRELNDPVVAVVRQLQTDFPQVDLELVICDRLIGTNLKVSNLANAVEKAKYSILIIADSDILVKQDYLQRIIQPFQQPRVGLVTCLYTCQAPSKIAQFEALGIATQFHASVLTARGLEGMRFALGSTMALRQSVLGQIGGFAAVSDHLADDYQLGYLCAQLGYEVVLSDYVVVHQLETNRLADFFHRQTRWARCIRSERFWGYLGLLLTQGTVASCLFWLFSAESILGWSILSLCWGLRLILAWTVAVKGLGDRNLGRWLWLVPLWDWVNFGIWLWGLGSDRVQWRGRTYQLAPGGKLIPLTEVTTSDGIGNGQRCTGVTRGCH